METIEKLVKLEGLIAKNEDLIGDDALILRRAHSIISPAELKAQLTKIAEDGRLLNIGIIGRVKAGKSSLLNALFFEGQSILPEAATPMTAALTVLQYGERCKAKAKFFSADDLDIIRREHDKYAEKIERAATQEEKQALRDDAERNPEKNPSFIQYEEMKKSGKNFEALCKQGEKEIEARNVSELAGKLEDFVGARGEYMPFTKSVEIHFNHGELGDVKVVDTPGVNDPIKSREERTQDYLRECDVVFIISVAGQFITDEDLDLMDRLVSREGVRELFLVASMADMGVILQSVVENSGGVLENAIDNLKLELSGQATETLKSLKERLPQISGQSKIQGQFDQLIDGGESRFFMVSGLCHSMLQRFDNKKDWTDGMKGVWNNLAKYYPDNFDERSGRANLELLADITPIKRQLARVRKAKDKIIAEKSADYRQQQSTNIEAFHAGLRSMIQERIEKLNGSDIQSLRKEQERLEDVISSGSEAIERELREKINSAQKRLKNGLDAHIRRLASDANRATKDETTEESHERTSREKKGGLAFIARFFGAIFGNTNWGYDVRTWIETTTSLRAGAVKNVVQQGVYRFSVELEEIVSEELAEIKNKLPDQIKKTIRQEVEDGLIDPAMLNRAVTAMVSEYAGDIVWNYSAPSFDYPSSGTIPDSEIGNFTSALSSFMIELERSSNNAVKELFRRIGENAAGKDPAQYIFKDVIKQLETLAEEIETKTTTLERFSNINQALKDIA
jgi:hypothetical protein